MHRSLTIRCVSATAALATALAIAGCSPAGGAAGSATPSAAPSGDGWDATSAALIAAFEDSAAEMMVPGAVMLVRTADGDAELAYGVTEWDGTTPVTMDDHIRIGSNTKTWTGTVILQLVEEGAIALDDPVSQYRPDVPNGENITIEQLLNMRSGLFNYTTTLELNAALDDTPDRVWDPEELVAMGIAEPPYFAPDEGYMYSNTNTILLGLIAEDLDGKPLSEIYEERIFTPLGLTETSFPELTDASIPAPYPHGYMFSNNVDTMDNDWLSDADLAAAAAGDLVPTDHTDANPSWAWSAGSGISTAAEIATWVEALGGGQLSEELLSDDMELQRLDSVQENEDGTYYGWGLAGMGRFYGHIGSLPGYNSFMGYDPETETTIVVWTNLAPGADGRAPAAVLASTLIDTLEGQ